MCNGESKESLKHVDPPSSTGCGEMMLLQQTDYQPAAQETDRSSQLLLAILGT
jgi:hypothetical protein